MTNYKTRIINYFKQYPITATLIFMNTVMVFIVIFTGSFTATNLVRWGGLLPRKINQDGEYLRLFTAMFLHGSVIHFLANTYFLYHIGGFIEKLMGRFKYILIYFISGLGSSLLVWWLGAENTVTIGASGALFGIMGALFVLTYTHSNWFTIYGIKSIRTLVFINAVFTLIIPRISLLGHLGGFITGVLIIYLLAPKTPHHSHYHQSSYDPNIIDHDDITDDDIYQH